MKRILHNFVHTLGLKMGGRMCYFIEHGEWIRVDKKATREWKRRNGR